MKLRKHKGSLDEEKLFENISKDDCGLIKKFTLGVCAMESKVESAPMECILKRLAKSGDFNIIKFKEDMILNQDIDSWPVVDCLIAFYSTGFPLKKAIEYVKKYKPITLNNLEKQLILRSRLQIYEQLKKWRVPHANYVVVDHDTVKKGEHVFEEYYDYIVYDNIRLNKPFIEKPLNADNHNNWIYYPKNTGGGCKKLFRKIKDRSSEYCPDIHKVRNNGTYIYEEFMSTFGTDIKVYTVGQMFAHAEARKAPSLDGKVCRTSDGKEVRYAVILSEAEKIIAYRIVEAFQQTVCGFDILRTTMGPFVCDVNGWSFVKGNVKYYNDCAHILRAMFLAKLEEKYNIIPRDLADNWYNIENEEEVLRKTFRQPDDLHCSHHEELCSVIIVMRHGDRKPKQKMKFITDKPLLLDYFNCEENLYNVIGNRSSIDDNIKINQELNSNIVSLNNVKNNKTDSSIFSNDTLTKINSKQNDNTSNTQKNDLINDDTTKINEINNDKTSQEDKNINNCENEKKNNSDNSINEKNNDKIEVPNESDATKMNNKDSSYSKTLKDSTITQSEEIKKNNLYKAYMRKEIKFKSPEELQDLFLINNIILNDIEKEYKTIKETIIKIQERKTEETTIEKRNENDNVSEIITLKKENINDKELINRCNLDTMSKEELEKKRGEYEIMIENHKTLQKILERGDGFTGINRKIQLKPLDLVIVNDKVIVTKILVVAKWGGELTRMGRRQSENLGKRFRATLYPGDSDGLLRLHSTFRHDFKIFTSDEGRCQITSAAFTKGFLDLDGELTPILVAMVIRNSKAHSLLDDNRPSFERIQCKEFIDNVLNENKNIDDDLLKKLASGKHSRGFRESLKKISNFYELMEKIRNTIYEFLKSLNQEVQKWLNLFPYDEYALYVIDILHEIQVRWKSLTKMWFKKNNNRYDTSKIPDIVDNIRFDLIHHHSYLGSGLDKAFEIYNLIEPLANYISQAEYGITSEEKVKIGVNIVGKLLRKLIHDVTFYRDEEERNKKNNKGNNIFKNAFHISYMNPFNFSKNDELKKEKNEEEKDSFKNFNMCKYDSKQNFLDNFLFKNGNSKIEKESYENENKNMKKINSEKGIFNCTYNDTINNLNNNANNNTTNVNGLNNISNGNNNINDQNVLINDNSSINESKTKLINDLNIEKKQNMENNYIKNEVKTQNKKNYIDKEIPTETEFSSGEKKINLSLSGEKKKEETEKSCLIKENQQESEIKIMKNKEEYISKNNINEIDKNILECDLVNTKCLEKGNETNSEPSHTKSIANKIININDKTNNNDISIKCSELNLNENINDLNNYKSSVTYNTNVKDLYTPKLINKKEALVINSSDLWAHQNKYRKENNEKQKMKKMKSTIENEFNEKKEDGNENNVEQKFLEKIMKQDDDNMKEIKEKDKKKTDEEKEEEKENKNENKNENEHEKEEEDEGEEEQEHDDDEDIIRLKETDARRLGIRSPWRMVRSRYYVTSASHMISLLNILIHAKNTDSSINQNIIDNDSIKSMGDVTDLHYLSHLVFRVWERKQLKRNDNNRFRIEILFSSGAKDGFGQNYELLEKDAKAQQQKYERHFNKYFDDNKKNDIAKNDTPENENKINKKSELAEQKNVRNDTMYRSILNDEVNLKIENKNGSELNINNENENLNKCLYRDINVNEKNNKLKETEMKNDDVEYLKNFNKMDNNYKNSMDVLHENSSNSSFLASSLNAKDHNLRNNKNNIKYSNSIDEIILNCNKRKTNLNYGIPNIEKTRSSLRVSSNNFTNTETFNSCNIFKREKEEKTYNLINKREMSLDNGSINEKKSTDNNNLNITGNYMVRSISSNLRKKNKSKDNLKLDYEKKEKEDVTKENLLTYENDCINLGSDDISRKSCRRSFSCLSDRSFYKNKKEDELNDDQKRKNNIENKVNLLEDEKIKNKFENSKVHSSSGSKKTNVFSHVFQHFNENKKNSTSNLNFFYKTYMPDYEKIIENDKKAETFDVPPYCELAPLIVLTKNCQLSTFENILTQVLNKYSKSTKNKEKNKIEKKVI
ncbi:acid phosphatase, putative [Plasmodium gallinaceum]|uniref:diphosphoinositol-pentakisphosphate 1-kinase n=1 Tax=Plasmodium gallinaceum TaxID=5849 RepID=A0A1J1GTN0_PLAGA|nr:acid phosphatase, putative [Plasmodium gallinaceum]CRG95807.1 acid phosphatase, putative [Plasmodium gallinaceum]